MNMFRMFFLYGCVSLIAHNYAGEFDKKAQKSIEKPTKVDQFPELDGRAKMVLANLVWDLSLISPNEGYHGPFSLVKTPEGFKGTCEREWQGLRIKWINGQTWLKKNSIYCNTELDDPDKDTMAKYFYRSAEDLQVSRVQAIRFIEKAYQKLSSFKKIEKSRRKSWNK